MVMFHLPASKINHWIGRLTFLLFVFVLFFSNSSYAQSFVKMTDQQRVELTIDMIRKGIQQQDTTKINMIVAPEVSVKGKGMETQATLSREFQTIFNSSYKRTNQLKKPNFPRADNPLHLSGFWDFDILDPKIEINGDSAVVECELVLWGAIPDKGSEQTGRRTKERFVFKSPPQVQTKIEQENLSNDVGRWPASQSRKSWNSVMRSWNLIGFENLLDFLNKETEDSHGQSTQREGK